MLTLFLVILAAVIFEYSNGFHDAANAIATVVSIYYYLGPNRESPTWQWVSIGGVVGMILWIVVSVGFGLYLNQLGEESYSKTYGSLAGVVILILYLFLTSLAVLVGGELNAEVERQGARRAASA